MSDMHIRRAVVRKVREYLADHLGDHVEAGEAKLNPRSRQWRVPVLAKSTMAIVPVGEFLLDEEAEFVAVPEKEQMEQTLNRILERVPCLVYAAPEELEAAGFDVVTV